MIITISGSPGTGTTTLARALSVQFGLLWVNSGELFRKIASEKTRATPGARRSWKDMSAQSKLMSGGSTSRAVASSASSAWVDE